MLPLWVTLSAVLAAPAPIKLAAPGLTALNLSPDAATYFLEHLGQQLHAQGVEVLTSTEIAALLGLERQKQLLGCTDDQSSCLTEMANALGTDGLLRGSLGKFGKGYQLDLKVLSSNGQTLASLSQRVESDEALLTALDDAARGIAAQLFQALHREPLQPLAASPAGPVSTRWLWWTTGSLGVAALIAGTVLMILAQDPSVGTPMGELTATVQRLALERQLGLGLTIGGAAAVGASVLLGLLTSRPVPPVTLVPTPQGAALVFSGSLP